jgi:hypothetical protein
MFISTATTVILARDAWRSLTIIASMLITVLVGRTTKIFIDYWAILLWCFGLEWGKVFGSDWGRIRGSIDGLLLFLLGFVVLLYFLVFTWLYFIATSASISMELPWSTLGTILRVSSRDRSWGARSSQWYFSHLESTIWWIVVTGMTRTLVFHPRGL